MVKNSDLHRPICLIECFTRDTMMAATDPISDKFGHVARIEVTGKAGIKPCLHYTNESVANPG